MDATYDLVGDSPVMRELVRKLERLGATHENICIHGERGTGKRLIARLVHESSARRATPLQVMACAAAAAVQQEDELLGDLAAPSLAPRGKLELAHGGTLVLDEVSELSPSVQGKLLRALEEGRLRRAGQAAPLDVRIIATTHRSLPELVRAGRFREDLFLRLAVVELDVPPLRARDGDIVQLAAHFLEGLGRRPPQRALSLAPEALVALTRYAFRGNVRELENAMHSAALSCAGEIIGVADLPPALRDAAALRAALSDFAAADSATIDLSAPLKLDEIERLAIVAALKRCAGNRSQVAHELGIGRTTLYRKLKEYGLTAS